MIRTINTPMALALIVCLAGCSDPPGAGVTVGTRCQSDAECFNGFRCLDGACIQEDLGDTGGGGDDASQDTDAESCEGRDCIDSCHPTCFAGEQCIDGACICTEGAARPCGSKLGICRYGQQHCEGREWSECRGGVQPETETCDGLDNDCDGDVDEGTARTFFLDRDGDGFGTDEQTMEGCEPEEGFTALEGDCDDDDDNSYPGADELCDQRDNNCNGTVDEGLATPWFADLDDDGWGDTNSLVEVCGQPDGHVDRPGDCHDGDAAIHPDAVEVCDGLDNNCAAGTDDEDPDLLATDLVCLTDGVCSGAQPVCRGAEGWQCGYPDAYQETETACDNIDNDCDGQTDEGLRTAWWLDADEDGHGAIGSRVDACGPPSPRHVQQGGDCADQNAAIHPDADEVCDGLDNDCDASVDTMDNGLLPSPDGCLQQGVCRGTAPSCRGVRGWLCIYQDPRHEEDETQCDGLDNDCDGVTDEDIARPCGTDTGVCTRGQEVCTFGVYGECTGEQGVPETDDESAIGLCDRLDNDCDGQTDEGCTCIEGDSIDCGTDVGLCTVGVQRCTNGAYLACDGVGPVAEVCDPQFSDGDCDGLDDIQEGLTTPYFVDRDRDGFGAGVLRHRCGPLGPGQAARAGDCDDDNNLIHPDAREVCDGLDNDCNNNVDDDPTPSNLTCEQRGVCQGTVPTCTGEPGWACVYDSPLYEQAETLCDGVDNDCDGAADEDLERTYFLDDDRDGFGVGAPLLTCGPDQPGQAEVDGDCNDRNPAIHPDADEVCDGLDNDCSATVDDNLGAPPDICEQRGVCAGTQATCAARNGWVCNYADPRYEPVETRCDDADNDCDGQTDENLGQTWYTDTDRDGYGTGPAQRTCVALGPGQAGRAGDCNDNNRDIHPGADEICNGIDDDCDNALDDNPIASDLVCEQRGVCAGTQPSCAGVDGWECVYDDPRYEQAETLCDTADNDCDGQTDENLTTTWFTDGDRDGFGDGAPRQQCGDIRAGQADNADDCDDGDRLINPDADERCLNGLDDDCDGDVDEGCPNCDPQIDADFDGANQCQDCDDTNGAVLPGADERCNGVDDDCDGLIDEDFDGDGDGWSVCALDPEDFDCDDGNENIHPGQPEDCGQDGRGNGDDDNCNGYIDEGCDPCDPVDGDGDGVSECDGDCAPNDGDVFPDAPELCDGIDNDCNLFTVLNCEVSDPCNHDGDGDFGDDADVCADDLICGQLVDRRGEPTGEYLCTAFCNTSETGDIGDGCAEDETCFYDLLRSAAVHGCARTVDAPGTLRGGETCGGDEECRSNSCVRIAPGRDGSVCLDYCNSDAYCTAPGTVCRPLRPGLDARCWPDASLGNGSTGDSCISDLACDHGYCANVDGDRYCTEACCAATDCPGGHVCALSGEQVDSGFAYPDPDETPCNNNSDCAGQQVCLQSGICARILTDTSPTCVPVDSGNHDRPAGSACSRNDQCRSDFCADNLGVCVEPCCSDAVCPEGLACELQVIETRDDRVTSARVCINISTDDLLLRTTP